MGTCKEWKPEESGKEKEIQKRKEHKKGMIPMEGKGKMKESGERNIGNGKR